MSIKVRICIVITLACSFMAYPVIASNGISSSNATQDTMVSLAGEWNIRINDDNQYAAPEYNDADWEKVALPGSLMPGVYRKGHGDRGVLWLRKTVTVDHTLAGDDIGLIIGRIAQADEVYFNGKKIGGMGSFPPGEFSMWNHPRFYQVPRSIILFGKPNVIAVRLFYHVYGDIVGTMGIASLGEWEKHRVISYFFLIIVPYLFIAMGATIFLIFVFFMFRKEYFKDYAYFCLQLFCAFLIILDGCNYWNIYGSVLNRFTVLGLAWIGVVGLHHRILHRIHRVRRPLVERAFFIYFLLSAVCFPFFINEGNLSFVGILFVCFTLPLGIYNITLNMQMLIQKRTYFRFFALFEFINIFGAVHDGAVYMMRFAGFPLEGAMWQYLIFPYTVAMFFVGIVMVLSIDFIRVAGEIKSLSLSLDIFASENAILNKRLSEPRVTRRSETEPQVNERAKEKIEQVIRYIKENYRENLSREGLAAMVDLHPDTLSRLFKKYTRKKIGDYISELRIDDATRMLVENTDISIIRIAFDIGFDSLRTFNRAFRKTKGIAPEQYRRTMPQLQGNQVS